MKDSALDRDLLTAEARHLRGVTREAGVTACQIATVAHAAEAQFGGG